MPRPRLAPDGWVRVIPTPQVVPNLRLGLQEHRLFITPKRYLRASDLVAG